MHEHLLPWPAIPHHRHRHKSSDQEDGLGEFTSTCSGGVEQDVIRPGVAAKLAAKLLHESDERVYVHRAEIRSECSFNRWPARTPPGPSDSDGEAAASGTEAEVGSSIGKQAARGGPGGRQPLFVESIKVIPSA